MRLHLHYWLKQVSLPYHVVQPIPLGVTFSNSLSELKAQNSNVSVATFHRKKTSRIKFWGLKEFFENVTPNGIGCKSTPKYSRRKSWYWVWGSIGTWFFIPPGNVKWFWYTLGGPHPKRVRLTHSWGGAHVFNLRIDNPYWFNPAGDY